MRFLLLFIGLSYGQNSYVPRVQAQTGDTAACKNQNEVFCERYGRDLCKSVQYERLCPVTCGQCGSQVSHNPG